MFVPSNRPVGPEFRLWLKRSASIFLSALFLLQPLAVSAAGTATTFSGTTVTRGDFVRAAVKALNLSVPKATSGLDRVPKSLAPYIQAAKQDDALGAFGTDLRLALPITRIEAARVAAELVDESGPSGKKYRDVTPGSSEEKAAALADARGWLKPFSVDYFGATRRLTGNDATAMMKVLAGKSTSKPTTEPNAATPASISIQLNGSTANGSLPKQQLIQTIWRIINGDYLHAGDIDEQEAAYSAIEAMVNSLKDPYSKFMRPETAKNFETQMSGEVSGIGAQVEQKGEIIIIVTPITGSPAEKAGLLPGDEITAVNGESIAGFDLNKAVEKIRGPRGTKVKLTIRRSGNTMEVEVTRDVVRVPEIAISWNNDIAIVKLMQFGRLTETELRSHMVTIQEQGPGGIILDLRNNPGGLLSAADVVISNFIPKDSVVARIKAPISERSETTKDEPTILDNVPVIVLVNGGSASASEIVAGALQDYDRATIIGEKTFGKGTVQEVLEFSDGSSLKLTIAEWLTPDGRKIDGVGVQPDILVPYESGRDAPTLKALDILK